MSLEKESTSKQSKNLRDPNASEALHWLQNEFTQRCRKNSRYSLRAFAKTLNIDASTLSQIFSGKRKLTQKTIRNFCKRLDVPLVLEGTFLNSYSSPREKKINAEYTSIHIDTFNVVADWYHTVILEMTEQKGFNPDPHVIAERLSISSTEAKLAIERLKRVGLLIEKKGTLQKVSKQLSNFKPGETSRAHRLLQKQVIEKTLDAVENVESEFKDITSIFMSIDKKKIPEARLAIQRFRHELCEMLEEGEVSQVYSLSVQLIPMEKQKEKK